MIGSREEAIGGGIPSLVKAAMTDERSCDMSSCELIEVGLVVDLNTVSDVGACLSLMEDEVLSVATAGRVDGNMNSRETLDSSELACTSEPLKSTVEVTTSEMEDERSFWLKKLEADGKGELDTKVVTVLETASLGTELVKVHAVPEVIVIRLERVGDFDIAEMVVEEIERVFSEPKKEDAVAKAFVELEVARLDVEFADRVVVLSVEFDVDGTEDEEGATESG